MNFEEYWTFDRPVGPNALETQRDPARSGAFQTIGTEGKFFHQDRGNKVPRMKGLNELREQGRMTWVEQEHGWRVAPEEILNALSTDGFEECKREMTTSRRDRRPAGGLWQGVNTRTGSEASAIWVNRPAWHQAIVFIDINGESLVGAHALIGCAISEPLAQREYDHGSPRLEPDPYEEEGGAVSGVAVSS